MNVIKELNVCIKQAISELSQRSNFSRKIVLCDRTISDRKRTKKNQCINSWHPWNRFGSISNIDFKDDEIVTCS